jgi:hypothetical protein
MSPRRRYGAMSAAAALCLLAGATATPAFAAAGPVTEGFASATATQAPSGWSVDNTNVAGMRADWQGWTFHPTSEITSTWGASGDRGSFTRADGMVAVVHSDGNRPTQGRFTSVLWAPELDIAEQSGAVQVSFDSHYKQGQAPQTAQLVARFDDGAPVPVESFASNRLDEQVSVSVPVPADTATVQIGWSYAESSNNWFWMIDDVEIAESAPAEATPRVLSSAKPVTTAGGTVPVRIGGLRPGQQLLAALGATGTPVDGVPVADAAGETSFTVRIPTGTAPGSVPLALSGDGVVATTVDITVLAAPDTDVTTTEPLLWSDGFEADTWTIDGGWSMSTLDDVVAAHGTDRRHAFTRADGRIAVAEAADGPVSGTLSSAAVSVTAGDRLEVRADSHFRARGAQAGTVSVRFDTGAEVALHDLEAADEESAQLRLPVTVPQGATAMTIRFAFDAASTAGSWMLDDVQVVRPLAPLAEGTVATSVVDIFSDVQGATTRLRDNVLPGFRGMDQKADVLVSNGDLVSTGSTANYTSYLAALAAGGGGEYETVVSTIGNHEYYGSEGAAVYRQRFLDSTGMRDTGGQGGLWGEVVVDGRLPVLWIGSEAYDYGAKTGSGPFVEFSEQQYTWLRDRLAYWRALDKPVLLFSHHLLPSSVSGSYARFYRNDYGQEQERFAALLDQNPNVIMFNSHTHWSPTLNDWSVQMRTDPSLAQAPTVVNTGAVTTMYGPSGDWEETAVGGADPVGLRAALYDDRVRVTVYSFSTTGATEIKHVDVPLPTDAPVQPVDPTISLDAATVAAGGTVAIEGSGFPAEAELAVELRSTPVRIGTIAVDATGAFRSTVMIPRDAVAGQHTIAVILPDGREATAAITVTPARGTGGTGGADTGSASGSSGSSGSPGSLAATGGGSVWMLVTAASVLLLGGGALALRRRVARR